MIDNLKDYLEIRLSRLASNGKLLLHDSNEEIWLALGVDKGGNTTKLSVIPYNVQQSNSINNLIMVGIYEGSDSYPNLKEAMNCGLGQQMVNIELEPYNSFLTPNTLGRQPIQ